MNFLQKLQNQPENIKRIILWLIVGIIGLGLFILYIRNIPEKLKGLEGEKMGEELQLPKIEMPKLEMPEISEKELRKVEEMIKEAE